MAFAGAVAYRHMDREQQRAVLQMITELEQGDHKRLAQRLRGYIAEQHSLGGMHHPETLSRREIGERLASIDDMEIVIERAHEVINAVSDVAPHNAKPALIVISGLAALGAMQLPLTREALEKERTGRH